MRQRRVDRAILSESSSDPIDSQDQELIVAQFAADNNRTLRWSLRLLIVVILAELPLVSMLASSRLRPNQTALLIVANVLVLINGTFEFPEWSQKRLAVSQAGVRRGVAWWRRLAGHVLSFRGVALLTAVVLVQLFFSLCGGPGRAFLFLVVPLVNLSLMVYVRKSHSDMQKEIGLLDSMRYKFKAA